MYLALWVCFLMLVGILFVVSTFIGAVIFGGFINGLVVGIGVTVGVGYILHKVGTRF